MSTIDLHSRRSDADLVALVRRGDEVAFTAIVARHRAALVAHARRIVRSPEDAEEVVQDAFVKAHAALRADSREMALNAWLHTIVRNRALDTLRRDRRQVGLDLVAPFLADPAGGPAEVAEQRAELGGLAVGLNALPRRQRDALVMHALDGASHAAIGDRLGVSANASKTLVCRARSGLWRELAAA